MPTEKGRQHACTDDGFQQKGRHYKNEENEKYNIRNLFFSYEINRRQDTTEGRINEFEDLSTEIIQSVTQRGKKKVQNT